jgi:hypothetical protein
MTLHLRPSSYMRKNSLNISISVQYTASDAAAASAVFMRLNYNR